MNKHAWRKITLFISILFVAILCTSVVSFASDDIDYIETYEITVEPNGDGTLLMTYHIVWDVLDDDWEGPLEWAEIGIWNKKASDFRALSDNIEDIDLVTDDGSYVDIYFKKPYYEGETADFTFSFTQSYCYTYGKQDLIMYQFNPGWFSEIKVGRCTVRWKSDDVHYTNSGYEEDGYYLWERALTYNETIDVEVAYEKSAIPGLVDGMDYTTLKRKDTLISIAVILGLILLVAGFVALIIFAARESSDGYGYYTGFYGGNFWVHPHRPHHHPGVNRHGHRISTPTVSTTSGMGRSGGGHSGGGCACACACACAGGGRAGCARKDVTKPDQLAE